MSGLPDHDGSQRANLRVDVDALIETGAWRFRTTWAGFAGDSAMADAIRALGRERDEAEKLLLAWRESYLSEEAPPLEETDPILSRAGLLPGEGESDAP